MKSITISEEENILEENIYEEYIYVDGKWEILGNAKIESKSHVWC